MNEAAIIAGCKKRSPAAQRSLFESFAGQMLVLCKRYVRDHHDAEEVLLTAFRKFFDAIDRFNYSGAGSVGPWLKKIVVNECVSFLRRKNEVTLLQDSRAADVIIDENVLAKMNAAAITRSIASLPDGYRVVFNLCVVEGYTHSEVAEMLNISPGTSKSQLSRAKALLQRMLTEEEVGYEKR